MNFLDKIVERKKERVATARKETPQSLLEERCRHRPPGRGFFKRLETPGPSGANIIAEIKRASPSKGVIRSDLNATRYARAYEAGGAACLSVLTDAEFFLGSDQDLLDARSATSLPVLRKDFIVSSYQVYETAAMGADAILLIVRILSVAQLQSYLTLSKELGLDALVEVHSEADVDIAVQLKARLIGINNRNLRTFETDTETAVALASRLLPAQIPVAASGITCRADIEMTLSSGIHNFLIGESLVRSENPATFLQALLGIQSANHA